MQKWWKPVKAQLVPAILIALVLVTSAAGLWQRLELFTYDNWFRLRGPQAPPGNVVVIGIDDRSIHELGLLPWPRTVYARLLEKLQDARVVAFDVVFNTPGQPSENAALGEAMKSQGRVVLASFFGFEQKNGSVYEVPYFPIEPLAAASAGAGFINTPQDLDNVARRVTAVDTNFFKRPFPCLSLAICLADRGLDANALHMQGNGWLTAGSFNIPLDRKNQVLINFWGPAGTFPTYSLADVLDGRVDANQFAGKIVLVGPTSPDEHDLLTTPFTRGNMVLGGAHDSPGVEVHASAVATFLTGSFYRQAPPALNLLFILLAGILTTLVVSRARGPWRGLAGLVIMAAVFGAAAYLDWYYFHYWIEAATPIAQSAFLYVGLTAQNLVRTELERQRTRTIFSRYLSRFVVDDLLKRPEDVVLGGIYREVTVLFSDIRGFTAFSENKSAQTIVQRLNEYFTEMTAIVFRHGGTLDKYLGDGLMAFFGAPVACADHAGRALAVAGEMLERLAEMNRRWQERGEPSMNIGIGINSGQVVVGNVGSPERMDYTVIGEEVNLASRLESLNKEYGTAVIVSERTVAFLPGQENFGGRLRCLGQAQVRGLTAPVGIFTMDFPDQTTGENC